MKELREFLSEDIGAMISTRRYNEAAMNRFVLFVAALEQLAEMEMDEKKKKGLLDIAEIAKNLENRLLRIKEPSPRSSLQ